MTHNPLTPPAEPSLRYCTDCGSVWIAAELGRQPHTCPHDCHAAVLDITMNRALALR